METFSALLAIVRGIHRSPVNSLHKGQWRGYLMFSLICAWINDWENNREAGDLIRHRTHYDVTVMILHCIVILILAHWIITSLVGGLHLKIYEYFESYVTFSEDFWLDYIDIMFLYQ